MIYDTLSAISLSDDDKNVWKERGLKTGIIYNQYIYISRSISDYDYEYIEHAYYLLRSEENAYFFESELHRLVEKCFANFVIKDNTGQISDLMLPTIGEILQCNNCNDEKYYEKETSPLYGRVIKLGYGYPIGKAKGTGIFQTGYEFNYNERFFNSLGGLGGWPNKTDTQLEITFMIPKEAIGKYSKFWIEPKQ